MRSLMKKDRPEPTPAVKYTKEMKFDICSGFVAEAIPNAFENPGRDGTTELDP